MRNALWPMKSSVIGNLMPLRLRSPYRTDGRPSTYLWRPVLSFTFVQRLKITKAYASTRHKFMKILIADKFEESGIEALKEIGCEVVYKPDLKDDPLVEAVRDSKADVLVVRSTKVTEAALAAGRLSLVVRAGAGYNTIDVKAASSRGIYVSNCPGKNSIAV